MKNFENLTPTELLKLINNTKNEYDNIKLKIIQHLKEYDILKKTIDDLTKNLEELEIKYVKLMEVLIKKQSNE